MMHSLRHPFAATRIEAVSAIVAPLNLRAAP